MSLTNQMLEIRGSVDFESKWNLQITADLISDRFLAGICFSDEIPGLREEVPAVKITKEVFGLTFILHGIYNYDRGSFTLEASPGSAFFLQLSPRDKTIDIGQWLAQLLSTVPEFKVMGHSPC
jgi:hypothetical protein